MREPSRPTQSSNEWRAYPTHRDAWWVYAWSEKGEVLSNIIAGEMIMLAIRSYREHWDHPDLGGFENTGAGEQHLQEPNYFVWAYGFFCGPDDQVWIPIHDMSEPGDLGQGGLFFSEAMAQKSVAEFVDYRRREVEREKKRAEKQA